MWSLPKELMPHILSLVPDKIYLNQTCKLYENILQQLFDNKQLSDHNDSYYLYKYYNPTNIRTVENHIPSITNYNSLNYIFYTAYFTCDNRHKGVYTHLGLVSCIREPLLLQYCIINFVTRIEYLIILLNGLYHKPIFSGDSVKGSELLYAAFKYESYDFIILLLSQEWMISKWSYIFEARYLNENNSNIIIKEINFLTNNHLMSLSQIYRCLHEQTFNTKIDVIDYLEQQLGENMVKYLTIK